MGARPRLRSVQAGHTVMPVSLRVIRGSLRSLWAPITIEPQVGVACTRDTPAPAVRANRCSFLGVGIILMMRSCFKVTAKRNRRPSTTRTDSDRTSRFWTAIPRQRQSPWPMHPSAKPSAENDRFRRGLLVLDNQIMLGSVNAARGHFHTPSAIWPSGSRRGRKKTLSA